MLFSDRILVENQFKQYCQERGMVTSPANFIVWLTVTPKGNRVIIQLHSDLLSELLRTVHAMIDGDYTNQLVDTDQLIDFESDGD